MNTTKINLFLAAVLVVVIFFTLPANNEWVFGKVLGTGNNWEFQFSHMDPETRRMSRFGFTYMVYQNAIHRITDLDHAVVLLPPSDYLTKVRHMVKFGSVEPALFYYYTGVIGVWANSPDVGKANWEIDARNDTCVLIKKITNREEFDSLIKVYKKYIKE